MRDMLHAACEAEGCTGHYREWSFDCDWHGVPLRCSACQRDMPRYPDRKAVEDARPVEVTVATTMHLRLVATPDGEFWRARTRATDGTELVEHARDRKRAAAFLYRRLADHLLGLP